MKRFKQPPLIEWGVASRTQPGQDVCGDLHVVKAFPDGTMVGVVDGLGSGDEALVTAKTAVAIMERYGKEPLAALVRRCDRSLMMTRGAALTVASFSGTEDKLTWLGVGNVQACLRRAEPGAAPGWERLRLYEGVVGYHVPVVRESSVAIRPGDLLVLASDGVTGDFEAQVDGRQPLEGLAEAILEQHFKGTDDALVLVAAYLGREQGQRRG